MTCNARSMPYDLAAVFNTLDPLLNDIVKELLNAVEEVDNTDAECA